MSGIPWVIGIGRLTAFTISRAEGTGRVVVTVRHGARAVTAYMDRREAVALARALMRAVEDPPESGQPDQHEESGRP